MLLLRPLLLLMSLLPLSSSAHTVYFGTYTNSGQSKGIYASSLTRAANGTWSLSEAVLVAETRNPSFLAWHPGRRVLVASGDLATEGQGSEGCVRVFAPRSAQDPSLELLGLTRTGSRGAPCHIALTPDGCVLASHYNEGFVASLRLSADNRPGELASRREHSGQPGPLAQRQDRAHAHSMTVSPDSRFVYACDLGLDRIFRYTLENGTGKLLPQTDEAQRSTPGFGPRHAKFSPGGEHFYVINELAGTIAVYQQSKDSGELTPLQTVSCLPEGYQGPNTSAEIQVHPSGRFVYASNRGPDTLAVLAREPATGRLTPLQHLPSGGAHPRHFALSPDGSVLVCANRDTDNVTLFLVNPTTGLLTPAPQTIRVPSAVCVVFEQ